MKSFLDPNAINNETRETLLLTATRKRDLARVTELLEQGAIPAKVGNKKTCYFSKDWITPIMLAEKLGYKEILEILEKYQKKFWEDHNDIQKEIQNISLNSNLVEPQQVLENLQTPSTIILNQTRQQKLVKTTDNKMFAIYDTLLGTGGSASVHIAQDLSTKELYAAKIGFMGTSEIDYLKKFNQFYAEYKNPNSKEETYVFIKLIPHISLCKVLEIVHKNTIIFRPIEQMKILKAMLIATENLVTHGVYHGDLKGLNLLFNFNNFECSIIDFGRSVNHKDCGVPQLKTIFNIFNHFSDFPNNFGDERYSLLEELTILQYKMLPSYSLPDAIESNRLRLSIITTINSLIENLSSNQDLINQPPATPILFTKKRKSRTAAIKTLQSEAEKFLGCSLEAFPSKRRKKAPSCL